LTIAMSQTPETTEAAPAKKSKKKLIIIVLAVVLLAGGGGGAYFMLGSSSGKPAAKPKPVAGAVVPLDSITVNLSGGHYLKIHLALQATADAGDKVDGSQALDLTVAQFSNHDMAEYSSEAGRSKAKAELLKAVEKAYDDKIMDIYFTEFVMQ
jgi:flagellar protein FliL